MPVKGSGNFITCSIGLLSREAVGVAFVDLRDSWAPGSVLPAHPRARFCLGNQTERTSSREAAVPSGERNRWPDS